MPFQSGKQRRYLWANEPEIARDWTNKYGSRVKKQLGGTLNTGYHGSPFYQNIMNQGFKGGAGQSSKILGMNMPTWAGSGKTFVASNPSAAYRYGAPIEVAKSTKNFTMPFGGGIDKRGISFAKETALDPKQATKGMQLMERLRSGKYLNSPMAQRLLKTGTTALTNPTNWARMLGVPLSALTGILSATPANADEANMTEQDWENLRNENATTSDNKIRAMRQDLRSVPTHMQRQTDFPIAQQDDEDDPYDFTDRLRRRKDFTTKYPSYNAWQMRGAQAPGLRRNAGRMMDFLRGPGTRLTPAQQRANQSYMNQQHITRDPQTGRMQGGLFAGQNAPGTSMFGSQTFPQMAQKWALKNQHRQYTTPKMQQKQQDIINIATGGRREGTGTTVTGHGKSGMGRDPSDRMARGGLASLWPR